MRGCLVGIIAVLGLGALHACGPSIRLGEQGAAYFEHCHALERDPRASNDVRAKCWGAWLAHWSETSTRDKIAHAEARSEALLLGEPLPPLEMIEEPEPHTVHVHRGEYTRHAGASTCDPLCLPDYQRCDARCPKDEEKSACRAACVAERRVCQLACY